MPARPEGSPRIIPYLYYEDATKALDFLVNAFGFEVISALRDDDGGVLTAQLRTGGGQQWIFAEPLDSEGEEA